MAHTSLSTQANTLASCNLSFTKTKNNLVKVITHGFWLPNYQKKVFSLKMGPLRQKNNTFKNKVGVVGPTLVPHG